MAEGTGLFHFLEPLWLLALLPLALLLWLVSRPGQGDTAWRRIVDERLQPLLMGASSAAGSRLPLWLLSTGWFVCVIALANPVWEQQPQPLLQTSKSRIIVLDLSRSMLTADLKPNRLERARFKVEDILAREEEGQLGLVVFAGDAFAVTPLTRDAETIRSQLRALEPGIMPSQGSRADLGLDLALELLQQAGVEKGQVILIADGVEGDLAADSAERIANAGHSVSVLGTGTPEGAPIYDRLGNMLRESGGKPVIAGLKAEALQRVALAGRGRYRTMTPGNADISTLLNTPMQSGDSTSQDDLRAEKWRERGPWLTLLLLPLAALAFRRGWLVSIMLAGFLLTPPKTSLALTWQDLWQRQDQQAAEALANKAFDRAESLATDSATRGSAAYKNGEYETSLEAFSSETGADAAYNRGNALARLGKLEEAVTAYDEALQLRPGMEDAAFNKAAVEALLKQQQEQEKNQEDEQSEENEKEQEDRQQDSQQKESSDRQQDDQQAQGSNQSQEQQQGESGQEQGSEEQQPSESQQSAQSEQRGNEAQQEAEQNQAGSPENQQKEEENQFANANEALEEQESGQQTEQKEQFTAEDMGEENPDDQEQQDRAGLQQKVPEQADEERQQSRAGQLTTEEQMAARQWLRRIPDDPGGLLRRKFEYQYQQRGRRAPDKGQGY